LGCWNAAVLLLTISHWKRAMHLYMQLYMPVLLSACFVTAGYVVAWMLNGGGIDPGPPNAYVGS
jgi:hypothetical protein